MRVKNLQPKRSTRPSTNLGEKAGLSIRKHDHFTLTREIKRHVRALASNHPEGFCGHPCQHTCQVAPTDAKICPPMPKIAHPCQNTPTHPKMGAPTHPKRAKPCQKPTHANIRVRWRDKWRVANNHVLCKLLRRIVKRGARI